MTLIARPWSLVGEDDRILGPTDCFLAAIPEGLTTVFGHASHARLLSHGGRELRLFPYPKSGRSTGTPRVDGLPARPATGQEPQNDQESIAEIAFSRMHEVLARIGELEAALDDPEHLWNRLAEAWIEAGEHPQPRMAEIVRQANEMPARLGMLENQIRRVLRRARERVPISRAQELDKTSMIWLARQPGHNTAERAGSSQRVLAIARHESFDTLENRVLHSYVRLAGLVCRQWMLEHDCSRMVERYRVVEAFSRTCGRFERELAALGVGLVESGITPNYILMEDREYRAVREGWVRLLGAELVDDDLWAWQAQAWTDFCVLAVTLSLFLMGGAEFVAQSPFVWRDEAETGRMFVCDNPMAVIWLRRENLIVEVISRPENVSYFQAACRAWVWLRVSNLSDDESGCIVPVWTPHTFERIDTRVAAQEAVRFLSRTVRAVSKGSSRNGLILLPANGCGEVASEAMDTVQVTAIALDASGPLLQEGMTALGDFVATRIGLTP